MSKEINTSSLSVFDLISGIQRILLYTTFFVIPFFVIPLPYDSTDKIKSILFIILSSLIILLEVIKWIWDGKISIVKSSFDKVFLLLGISFLISFVFAKDTWVSMWGYDGRMGTGFLVMIFLFIFFYLARGFLVEKGNAINAVKSLSVGLLLLIVLSLLSVLKVEVFAWLPYVKDFFVVGLPLTFSFQEIMLIAGSAIFLNIFLVVHYIIGKKYQSLIYPALALVVSFISLPLFSVNQGALIPILFFVVSIFLCLLLLLKLEKSQRVIPAIIFIFSILILVFSIGFQYESFRKSILGESFTTINPIHLGADISWVVASSSIVSDFFRGIVGLGNDSFAMAYHSFRPATDATISLGNMTFTVGSNEIFTILANRGFIGVTVWIILGFTLLKVLIKNITTHGSGKDSTLPVLLGLNTLFLYLGSIFIPYSFLMYFLLLAGLLLMIVLENKETFLVKFWAVNEGTMRTFDKTMESINWFFTVLVTLITTAGIVLLFVKTVGIAYVVRAEAYTNETNLKYQNYEGDIPLEEREAFLERIAGYYTKALQYDSSDPYVNRKSSLIALEVINLLSEKSKDASDEDKKAIQSEVSLWKNTSIDLSREAVTTSPLTYSNWNTRAAVYMGLIGNGLSDYSEDALYALQSCINLNPLDYDAYYKAGQIRMVQEDYEQALNAFNSVLNINGQHVPSLVLAARILQENGDTERAITYLEAAKQILEVNEQDSGDIYDSILKSLQELGADTDDETEENITDDTEDTTDNTEVTLEDELPLEE